MQKSHWPAELVGPRAATPVYDEPASIASGSREDSLVTAEVVVKQGASPSKLSAPHDKAVPVDDAEEAASSESNTLDRVGSHSEVPGLLQRITNLRRGHAAGEAVATTGKLVGSRAASVTTPKALRRASMESAVSSARATSVTQTIGSKTARTNSGTWVGRGKGSTKSRADGSAVRGVKVRMGVASGWVPADADITRSALFELAKGTWAVRL